MKESLAAVLAGFQSLGSDDSREKPVDRLAALGQIQNAYAEATAASSFLASLGVALISFKFANQPSSKSEAEDKLAIALSLEKLRLTAKERDKIARQAVMEWAIDFCPACSGRKEVPDQTHLEGPQRMKPCMGCASTGKRRYSDAERIEALGRTFERAMDRAHSLITEAERQAIRGAREMLERW